MTRRLSQGNHTAGFTLIELILVAAIIGMLAAIAIPKFGNLLEKAIEAREKAALGSVRSSLGIYYADNEGLAPGSLDNLYPKYIDKPTSDFRAWPLPKSIRTNHPGLLPPAVGGAFSVGSISVWSIILNGGDDGAWVYRHNEINNYYLNVNCLHNDVNGRVWSSH